MSKELYKESRYTLSDLLYLMERLRDPAQGCPWDLRQTFKTIVPSTLEEAYEVAETIENEDYASLEAELGDLLFQTVFYSQLGKEQGLFNFESIVSVLVDKLLRRHPHVFPNGVLADSSLLDKTDSSLSEGAVASVNTSPVDEQIKHNWENIKQKERELKGCSSVLDDIPHALPALTRALKLQKRAATVGFDWDGIAPVMAKFHEELHELEAAIQNEDQENIEEELGDLLFCLVNISRHLKKDPDAALRGTNRKFTRRFQYIEKRLQEEARSINSTTLEELEALWVEAKLSFRESIGE